MLHTRWCFFYNLHNSIEWARYKYPCYVGPSQSCNAHFIRFFSADALTLWFFWCLQVYITEISFGDKTWTVRRRYSEFLNLRTALQSSYNDGKIFSVSWWFTYIMCISCLSVKGLSFPPKVFNNFSLHILESRRQELDIFLQSIVKMVQVENNGDLRNFLNLDLNFGSPIHQFNLQSKQQQTKSDKSEELKLKMSSLEKENALLRTQKRVMAQLLYKYLWLWEVYYM